MAWNTAEPGALRPGMVRFSSKENRWSAVSRIKEENFILLNCTLASFCLTSPTPRL